MFLFGFNWLNVLQLAFVVVVLVDEVGSCGANSVWFVSEKKKGKNKSSSKMGVKLHRIDIIAQTFGCIAVWPTSCLCHHSPLVIASQLMKIIDLVQFIFLHIVKCIKCNRLKRTCTFYSIQKEAYIGRQWSKTIELFEWNEEPDKKKDGNIPQDQHWYWPKCQQTDAMGQWMPLVD